MSEPAPKTRHKGHVFPKNRALRHEHCGGRIYFDNDVRTGDLVARCTEQDCCAEWKVTFARERYLPDPDQLEIEFPETDDHLVCRGFPRYLDRAWHSQWEDAYMQAWEKQGIEVIRHVLADDAIPWHWRRLDQRSISLVASVIQWLGTNIGQGFVERVIESCGYQVVAQAGIPPKKTCACRHCNLGAKEYLPRRVEKVRLEVESTETAAGKGQYSVWVWRAYHLRKDGKRFPCPQIGLLPTPVAEYRRMLQSEAESVMKALKEAGPKK